MANELSLQQKFQEKVADSIKSNFLDLIPKEEFDKMVGAGMDEFINGNSYSRRHNSNYTPSNDPNTLPGMIMTELKDRARAQIKLALDSPEFRGIWDCNQQNAGGTNGGYAASEAVKQVLTDNPEVFVRALFGGVMQSVLMQLQSQFR